jgi:hypothetical protein
MPHYYAQTDDIGFVHAVTETSEEIDGTGIIPIGSLDNSLLGKQYVDGVFVLPPLPAPPVWVWYIDIGPFFDRFGAAKMAVLTSTDPGVRALLADIQIRKWIDLQNASVAQGVAYIGSVIPAVDAATQSAILTTPVSLADNLALRKLYFGA